VKRQAHGKRGRLRRRSVPSVASLRLDPAEEGGGLAGEHGAHDDVDLAGLRCPVPHLCAAGAAS
jgi:hypothetical protein